MEEGVRAGRGTRWIGFVALLVIAALLLGGCTPTAGSGESEPTAGAATVPNEGATTPAGPESPAVEEPGAARTTTPASDQTPAVEPSPTTETPSAEEQTLTPGTALAQLATLERKGRAPRTGYDRESFGWREDTDRNGCDTRNDVLRRDLQQITLKAGTGGCVVQSGSLLSPYSGETIAFDRSASTIDIDHVVALSDAWQTGAQSWDEETRVAFANDPRNLLAVESALNRQKGDGDAATWLPPSREFRCEYVARQISVKAAYDLWVKPAEAEAMERVLGQCVDHPALASEDPWPAAGGGDVVGTASEATTEPDTAERPAADSGSGEVREPFENCTAAREAGAAPVDRGDPGYGEHLDGDSDGVGCE